MPVAVEPQTFIGQVGVLAEIDAALIQQPGFFDLLVVGEPGRAVAGQVGLVNVLAVERLPDTPATRQT